MERQALKYVQFGGGVSNFLIPADALAYSINHTVACTSEAYERVYVVKMPVHNALTNIDTLFTFQTPL